MHNFITQLISRSEGKRHTQIFGNWPNLAGLKSCWPGDVVVEWALVVVVVVAVVFQWVEGRQEFAFGHVRSLFLISLSKSGIAMVVKCMKLCLCNPQYALCARWKAVLSVNLTF